MGRNWLPEPGGQLHHQRPFALPRPLGKGPGSLGVLGPVLGSYWAHLGLFSISLGMNFAYFAPLWAHLGASQHPLDHFELPWLHFYPPKR